MLSVPCEAGHGFGHPTSRSRGLAMRLPAAPSAATGQAAPARRWGSLVFRDDGTAELPGFGFAKGDVAGPVSSRQLSFGLLVQPAFLAQGRQLHALPAESFDACVFSMVLHHWTQEHQRESLDKAPPKNVGISFFLV